MKGVNAPARFWSPWAGSRMIRLFFLFTDYSTETNAWISRLRRRAFGSRINSAGADFRAKAPVLVIQPFVLERVSHHSLNVETCFAEGNRLSPFIQLERKRRTPLHDALWTGVVSRGDVFDMAVLVELIAQICSTKLNIQSRLEQ